MNLSPMAQATVLLTCYFSAASVASINNADDVKPLSTAEWGRFALWLNQQGATPADLLAGNVPALLQGCESAQLEASRILQLLQRGHSLALALEKWQRAGLWLVTRSDAAYPARLKQRLKNASPPVLFGCGNKTLLNAGGLAVVGSRNAGAEDLLFTQQVGAKAAAAGVVIVSGGARGVDEAVMLGAVHSSGSVIGVLADSLLKVATSAKWRQGLMDGTTVLISSVYPEAAFSAANAMARNRYIYCLADSALVIHAAAKGGTFNGATENLQQGWVPLWVKPTTDIHAANAGFVAKGGRWVEADINNLNIAELLVNQPVLVTAVGEPLLAGYDTASQLQADLFDTSITSKTT